MFLNYSIAFAILSIAVGACGRGPNKGDEIISLSKQSIQNANSSSKSSSRSQDAGAEAAAPGSCTPAQPIAAEVAFTFEEAKTKCIACHSTTGVGKAKWATADGSEADWKAVAAVLKLSVLADRMPMPAFSTPDNAKFIGFLDSLIGEKCPPNSGTQPISGPSVPGAGAGAGAGAGSVEMTLAEAKVKCAACHQPGGGGSAVWDKANGTETDWAAFATAAKASVSAGRMPLGGMSADEKTRMLTFLDRLLGVTSAIGSMPAPIVYNFTTARTLCVGCHSSQAPRAQRQSPDLETDAQWLNNKRKIEREVDGGAMPEGKILSSEERAALLTFIRSL